MKSWFDQERELMATALAPTKHLVMADLKGKVDPDWCPGCGDFGVLAAVQKALVELQIPTHQVVTISGIGCSSNFPGYINTYGMHTLHGRALAVATGVKLANHDLTVVSLAATATASGSVATTSFTPCAATSTCYTSLWTIKFMASPLVRPRLPA